MRPIFQILNFDTNEIDARKQVDFTSRPDFLEKISTSYDSLIGLLNQKGIDIPNDNRFQRNIEFLNSKVHAENTLLSEDEQNSLSRYMMASLELHQLLTIFDGARRYSDEDFSTLGLSINNYFSGRDNWIFDKNSRTINPRRSGKLLSFYSYLKRKRFNVGCQEINSGDVYFTLSAFRDKYIIYHIKPNTLKKVENENQFKSHLIKYLRSAIERIERLITQTNQFGIIYVSLTDVLKTLWMPYFRDGFSKEHEQEIHSRYNAVLNKFHDLIQEQLKNTKILSIVFSFDILILYPSLQEPGRTSQAYREFYLSISRKDTLLEKASKILSHINIGPDFSAVGPAIYKNWNDANVLGGDPIVESEVALYSDADIIGESKVNGPYSFLVLDEWFSRTTLPRNVRPFYALRYKNYLDYDKEIRDIALSKTDHSLYHAGDEFDEAASIYSLLIGARIKAGGVLREFSLGDTIGFPIIEDPRVKNRIQFSPPINETDYILPWHVERKRLEDLDFTLFENLIVMQPIDVTALIRSTRLYQESVWISESTPELSWLLLVSAIEVAAERWAATQTSVSDQDLLKYSKKTLFDDLGKIENGEEALEIVAKSLSGVLGATKKFIDFCMHYFKKTKSKIIFPKRPEEAYQISFSNKKMNKIFSQIYDYRSKALHAGTPFPKPLCMAPLKFRDNSFAEKPLGDAIYASQGVWAKDALPIHFHIFECITRNILLEWWKDMQMASMNSES